MFVGLLQGTLAWQANQSSSSRICSFGIRCVLGSPLERTRTFSPAPFGHRLSAERSKEEAQGRADLTLLPAFPSSLCLAHCSTKRPRSCHHSVVAVGDLDIDWPLMLRCWLMFFFSWSPGRSRPRSAVGLPLEAYCCAGSPGRSWTVGVPRNWSTFVRLQTEPSTDLRASAITAAHAVGAGRALAQMTEKVAPGDSPGRCDQAT